MLAGDAHVHEGIGHVLEAGAEMVGDQVTLGQQDQEDGGLGGELRTGVDAREGRGGEPRP